MMKPSITCVNIFGFFDLTEDLVDTTGFSSRFFSWFTLLVFSGMIFTGFDLSSAHSFAAVADVLTWSWCMAVVAIVDRQSISATVVDSTATTVVTTGTETELVDDADAVTHDAVVFALALTTAVSEPAGDC